MLAVVNIFSRILINLAILYMRFILNLRGNVAIIGIEDT